MKKISMLTNNKLHPSTVRSNFYGYQNNNARSFSMFSAMGAATAAVNVPGGAFPSAAAAAQKIIDPSDQEEEDKPKMTWGEPTWFLLHTIAEKISEQEFQARRTDILNIIYTICTNLPCHICSDHAKEYLTTKVNFRSGGVRTRTDLKQVLFQFHNTVNQRKNYPIFTQDQLNEKYARANVKNIVYNFFANFQDKSKNPKKLSNELYRSRIVLQLKEWFKENIGIFDSP
jgi:hypothetical protein